MSLSGVSYVPILRYVIDVDGRPIRHYAVDPSSTLGRLMFAEADRQDAAQGAPELGVGGALEG